MNLVERMASILLTPKTEWPVIAGEPGDPKYLFTNYVAFVGAVPAIVFLVGSLSRQAGGMTLFLAIFLYLLGFAFSYLVALVVNALAPIFGGQKNFENALKLTVYSYTPGWLATILVLIPPLRFLNVLMLYSVYLFWVGASPLMKVSPGKAIGYTAAAVVSFVMLFILLIVIVVGLLELL